MAVLLQILPMDVILVATRAGLELDYVITEVGFGADLGAEKRNIKAGKPI